ncbi:MAG: hypothetical protein Q8O30_08140 [Candidatus Omnitrophota bacterium]|nr:hypothetical protein [Candidatus Omnitrophota bacterium]
MPVRIGNVTMFIEVLQKAIDAENTLRNCCSHLSSLIHNGRIRKEFNRLAEVADNDTHVLSGYMRAQNMQLILPENKCKYCKIKPESFSLEGAVNLGLEIVSLCEALYKDLTKLTKDYSSKTLFENLRKEKAREKNFLKREKRFIKENEPSSCIINEYCIPEIAAKLWK